MNRLKPKPSGTIPTHPAVLNIASYIASPFLVWATTWVTQVVDRAIHLGSGSTGRPFGIVFLLPIVIVTILGGRGPGYLTLALSLFSLTYFLTPPYHSVYVATYADAAEIAFVALTGILMVVGLHSLRALGPLLYESEQAGARLQAVMDTAPIGVLISALDGGVRYANAEAERILGRRLSGLRLDACEFGLPSDTSRRKAKPADSIITPCLQGKDVEHREWVVKKPDGETVTAEARATLVRDDKGRPINGLVTLTDISERKRGERAAFARANREALVNRIGEAIRESFDPDQIQNVAVTALGEALKVDRCYFVTYDFTADYAWIGGDYHRADLASMSGHYRTSDMRIRPDVLYRPGRSLVIDDVGSVLLPPILVTDFERLKMRAIIGVPIFADNQLVATLVVAMADEARTWGADEIVLVEAVAAQTRSAVEIARLLIHERNRRRVEEVSAKIAQTLRYATDPDVILARTLSIVGATMDADRCCYISVGPEDGKLWCADDYFSEDYTSLAGSQSLADLGGEVTELFSGGATVVVNDVDRGPWAEKVGVILSGMDVKAMIAVPIFDEERLGGILMVAMARTNREWKAEEIRLMEMAASQARLTLDTARIRQREHTVAETLQSALQPEPVRTQAFELDYFYLPALDEASVGGDFYDVFEIRKDAYAIIIGDVSGKGIAAAAQIASVRNMLRYAIDHEATLASGLTHLNDTLVRSGQMTGFATLFVGIYDRKGGTLTYGSCGHEPALIRRSDDTVVALESTGPPVGAIDGVEYDQQTVELNPGDLLLLYTDGISEAGPNRKSLLGTPGLIEILTRAPHGEPPPVLISRLMADVKSYSNGVLRDDVCVVAAVIEPEPGRSHLTLIDTVAVSSD